MLAKLVKTALGFYMAALVASFTYYFIPALITTPNISNPLQFFQERAIRWALLLILIGTVSDKVVEALEGRSPNLIVPAIVLFLIGGYEVAAWGNFGGIVLIFAASLLIVAKFLPMLTVVAVVASAIGLYYAWPFLKLSTFGPFGEILLVVIAAVVYYLPEFLGLTTGRSPDDAGLRVRKLGLAALGVLFSIGVVISGFQAIQLGGDLVVRVISLAIFVFLLLAGLLGVVAAVDVIRKVGLPQPPPPPPRLPPPPPPPPPRPPPPSKTVVMGESDVEVRPYREEEE